jgi:hypothetical protein
MKKNLIQTVAFALAFIPCFVMAQGTLVINGGFVFGADGWTLINGAHIVPTNGYGTNLFGVLGNSSPSPSVLPTASQTINSLTPGLLYYVSGDFAKGKDQMPGGSPLNPSFGVLMDNVVYFQAVAPENFDWQNFTFYYTATASSAVLSLSSYMNGTEVPYFIDNIAMYAVPEPSAGCLLFLSSGLLIFVRKAGHEIMRRASALRRHPLPLRPMESFIPRNR